MKAIFWLTLIIFSAGIILLRCSSASEPTNAPPHITELSAIPATVAPGDTAGVSCVASDPDNDQLTYTWETTGGIIEGTGSTVSWIAPGTIGLYSVSCMVEDDHDAQDIEAVSITVEENMVPTAGLVAYYPFNGNANDESGNGYNGTVMGAALSIDRFGEENRTYSFDGINDYIVMGDILNNLNIPFTVSCWVSWAGQTTSGHPPLITSDNHPQFHYQGFSLFIHNDLSGRIVMSLGDGGIAAPFSRRDKNSPPGIIALNTWAHVTVVVQGLTNMKIYINGIDVGGTYAGSGGNMVHTGHNFVVARYTYQSSDDRFFKGKIDDIRIYNRALSAEEILALYHEGDW